MQWLLGKQGGNQGKERVFIKPGRFPAERSGRAPCPVILCSAAHKQAVQRPDTTRCTQTGFDTPGHTLPVKKNGRKPDTPLRVVQRDARD